MIKNVDTITVEFLEQLVYFCNESVKRESRDYYADTKVIRNELMKLFRAYVLSLKKPAPSTASKIKVTAEVQKILNEAR